MVTNTRTPLEGNTTVLEANEFAIKSVKLFSSGGAEVTRIFPLSFLRPQDEPQVVEIIRLPAGLQSVHVSVTSTSGNVTILDHYDFVQDDPEKISNQKLRELQTERARLEDERRLRQQSFRLLTTYMDSLAQCKSQVQTEADQMVAFLSDFVEVGIARSAEIAELENKMADLDDRIVEQRNCLSRLSAFSRAAKRHL
ncbi:hypothetical protein JVU11DRAFT_12610 [Chiua virens]|nr:hypothetical protein JVU11DRAFT_12610 [Chiua virens]